MKGMAKGMATYHDQEKDREKWQQAMEKRAYLIKQLRRWGIKTAISPTQMKIRDIEKLLVERVYNKEEQR